jgi:hypothetical protein
MTDRPYQAEVYEGRQLDRANETAVVSKWHQRFLERANPPSGSVLGEFSAFRTTAGSPLAAELEDVYGIANDVNAWGVGAIPAILSLDTTDTAPIDTSLLVRERSDIIDASAHILTSPMPTVLTDDGAADGAAAPYDEDVGMGSRLATMVQAALRSLYDFLSRLQNSRSTES